MSYPSYDIIVIGCGHAGLEASSISLKHGLRVCIISLPGVDLASAPCNPAIGGVGKGQVVREIDCLGGAMGLLADKSAIQYRTLNTSKGYAVQSTRVQIDKELYSKNAEMYLKSFSNLTILREKVTGVSKQDDLFRVVTSNGNSNFSKKLIVTTGTFLNSKTHIGLIQKQEGRYNSVSSNSLKDIFSNVKSLPKQFKTGTPPRIDKNSIDFTSMIEQKSDDSTLNFHFQHKPFERFIKQTSCYLTHTNVNTIKIISDNMDKSPMFNGQISGIGPRYCPSIEDKVSRFSSQSNHHVFVEPESYSLDTFYPNGISTSLPLDVQYKALHSIKGLENAKITIPGYAVEYDVVDTTFLDNTLEHQDMRGLYFAGQVNGTSGYEEAAGQGLIAGINASRGILGDTKFTLSRYNSYIGIMIDDLISNKRDEPYRLFTARSENRLLIREDNVVNRLYSYRKKLKIIDSNIEYLENYVQACKVLMSLCKKKHLAGNKKHKYNLNGSNDFEKNAKSLSCYLQNPDYKIIDFLHKTLVSIGLQFDYRVICNVAIELKYEGYINKTKSHFDRIERFENKQIDFIKLLDSNNISTECKTRIREIRPKTIGQLKRINGIRPATVSYVVGTI